MKKKKWLIPVATIMVIIILAITGVGIMINRGYGASTGVYIESKDGVAILIRKKTPIVLSSMHNGDMFNGVDVGEKILVIHDGIAESYPAKTRAYAVFKIKDGVTGPLPPSVINELIELGWLDENPQINENVAGNPLAILPKNKIVDIGISYANWTDSDEIYTKSLNIDKMAISSVKHMPIYKFDKLSELKKFKSDFDDILTMDQGYDEVPSFNEIIEKYDEDFFIENTVLLVYVDSGSGSERFGVNQVYCDGNSFHIHVEQTNNPEIGTCDMAGWFITVAVPDSMVENCTEFDASFTVLD